MIDIYLLDDEILFIQGLKQLINDIDNCRVTKTFTTPSSLLEDLEKNSILPDVLFVDMKMPEMNGIELSKIVISKYPSVKVIGLSSYYSNVLIFKMLELGAAAYLPKNTTLERLEKTIHTTYNQGFYFEEINIQKADKKTLGLVNQESNDHLTDREVDVLILICEQLTTQEIADKLFISLKTVERHRTNLFKKTGVKNVVGLVIFALKKQLITHSFI